MSVLDRLRRRPSPAIDAGWDDAGIEHVAGQAAALATAWDADPDDVRVTAGRAAVLGAFAAAETSEFAGAADRPPSAAGAAPGYRRGGRRPALVLVAAAMLLAMTVGAVAASAPGGPLYDVRVDAEAVSLPASPGQRAAAQVDRLEQRVADAVAATARSDVGATRAALRAYARIATQAAAGAAPDPRLAARVRAQLEVIARLGVGEPSLDAAREQVRVAARLLLGALGDPGAVPGDGPGPGPQPSPGASGEPGPGASPPGGTSGPGGPGASPGPGSSAGPGPSGGPGGPGSPSLAPSPGGSAGPGPSAGPGRTPVPEATPKPTPRATASPSPTTSPSPTPDGGSGPGGPGGASPSPGGGPGSGGATPSPSGGSGSGGGAPQPAAP